jgi:hypothetical protein
MAAKRKYDADVVKGVNLLDAIQKTHDQLVSAEQQIADMASKINAETAELAALKPDAPDTSAPDAPAATSPDTPGVEVANPTPAK